MKIKLKWNENSVVAETNATESDVYKFIGSVLPDMKIPNTLIVETDQGDAVFNIGQRGTFIKDGIKHPSMFVTPKGNTIRGLASSNYECRYLTCINSEGAYGNYKFYKLYQEPDGIYAEYGRIGSKPGEMWGARKTKAPFPSYMFWIRYYEKLSKGYTDQTDVYLGEVDDDETDVAAGTNNEADTEADIKQDPSKNDKPTPSETLYKQLYSYAKHIVQTTLVDTNIKPGQVKASKKLMKELYEKDTVDSFNETLMKLMTISPRKCEVVASMLAKTSKDFPDIIDREENLIFAMEAVITGGKSVQKVKRESFDRLGIEVYLATDKQKEQVIKKLDPTLQGLVKTVYRVIPKKQQKDFNEYLKKNGIKKVKQLWHGSRNGNWFSIMENGLQLHPNAPITGKMFGHGIYFAPSSRKSWGYTSYSGSYWARGNDTTAFMGLYATAYGNPYDTSTAGQFTKAFLDSQGKNCVHAHAGVQLRNDEIIYYDEKAMVLNYIVEFAA